MCGFQTIFLKKDDNEWVKAFKSGKPLKSVMFEKNLWDFPAGSSIAVFERINESESFTGLINKNPEGRMSYCFVLN